MSYVEDNLTSGEKVIYQAKVHPLFFISPILLLIFGALLMVNSRSSAVGMLLGLFIVFTGIIKCIISTIAFFTTELAVTNKRVIAKAGFINRYTIELNHNKVEGFQIDQPVIGRLLGYGTVLVCGTGGSKTGIPNIAAPMEFRKQAVEIIDQSQS